MEKAEAHFEGRDSTLSGTADYKLPIYSFIEGIPLREIIKSEVFIWWKDIALFVALGSECITV